MAYGIVGLVLGAFCSLIAGAGVTLAPRAPMLLLGRVGVFAVILCPIIYGIIGGISGVIGPRFTTSRPAGSAVWKSISAEPTRDPANPILVMGSAPTELCTSQ